MSFDWSEYLVLAQELTNKSSGSSIQEAYLRAAVSRAYYAAFCNARNHLIYKDGYSIPATVNVHTVVIDKFEKSPDKTRQKIGTLLCNLRGVRNIVDYQEMFYGNHLGRTKGVLVEANQIISLLKTI